MLSTAKDREQIEYLINRYEESIDNLVDIRTQIWDKLDTDDEYVASVTTRLSNITEKLAAPSLKRSLDVILALMTIQFTVCLFPELRNCLCRS